MRYSQPRALTLAQQYVNLRGSPICAGHGSLQAAHLVWSYTAVPTPISRDYRIRIEVRQGRTPEVFVDDPDLTMLAGGRRLPHVYQQKPPRLCLYLPKTGQWGPCMRIDLTFVPWASLWLFYFEDWLITDNWKGGGMHPPAGNDNDGHSMLEGTYD